MSDATVEPNRVTSYRVVEGVTADLLARAVELLRDVSALDDRYEDIQAFLASLPVDAPVDVGAPDPKEET